MANKKATKKKATPVKRVPKPDVKPGPIEVILKKGCITTKDRRLIHPGGKFSKEDVGEEKFKMLEERGLIERFTAEKKDIVKK